MTTREELETNVETAKANLAMAESALAEFDAEPENHRYDDLDKASGEVEDKLMSQAFADCQGAYNCGADEYTQDFYVGDKLYRGTLKCEYNRHDKTYYYIDGHDFTVTEVV